MKEINAILTETLVVSFLVVLGTYQHPWYNHDTQSGGLLLYAANILSHKKYKNYMDGKVIATICFQYSHFCVTDVPIQDNMLLQRAARILNRNYIQYFCS